MRRIRITVSYDGTNYHGWQVQPAQTTIQSTLEDVLTKIESAPVRVDGSGRTDAGVHALAQVAAFSLSNPIPTENLLRAMNRLLPGDIRVNSVEEAAPDFHRAFRPSPRPTNIASSAPKPALRLSACTCTTILIRSRWSGCRKPRRCCKANMTSPPLPPPMTRTFPAGRRCADLFFAADPGGVLDLRRRRVGVSRPGQRIPEAHGPQHHRGSARCWQGNLTRADIEKRLTPGSGVPAGPTARREACFW